MLYSICQQIWKIHQCPQDWKRSVFIPIPKKGNAKECSNYYCTIALISHAWWLRGQSVCLQCRRLGSIPGSGRSPGKGNGNSFQESWLENPINRGAWWATVHGAASVRHDLATKLPPSLIYVYFCPHHGVCGILSPGGMHDLITPTGIEPLTSAVEASLCFPICLSLLKLASIESVIPSNHLILCCPLLLPSIFPSIRIFSSDSE